jgi:hypothetical protein
MSFLDRAKHTLDTAVYNIDVARTIVRAKLEDGMDAEIEPVSMDDMFRPKVHETEAFIVPGDGYTLAARQQRYVDKKYGPMFCTDAQANDDGTVRIRVPKEYSEDGWATIPTLASRNLKGNQKLITGLSGVNCVAYAEADYENQVDCLVIKDGQETTTKVDRMELQSVSDQALEAHLWLEKVKEARDMTEKATAAAQAAASRVDAVQADDVDSSKPRMVFANYVSDKLIREQPTIGAKNNNDKSRMMVQVPCNLSENGYAVFSVTPKAVHQQLRKGEPVKGYSSVALGTPDKLLKVGIGEGPKQKIVNMRAADIVEMLEFERASYWDKIRSDLEAKKPEHADEILSNTNDAFRGMGDPSADVGTPTDPISENQMNI